MTTMPLLFSLLIIILAPVIQCAPRYALPVIFALPFVLSYYMYCDSKDDINNNKLDDNNGQDGSMQDADWRRGCDEVKVLA